MNILKLKFMSSILERWLHSEASENEVNELKNNTQKKVEEVTVTLKKAGKLQTKVMKKTTTFFIAQAMGSVKE